MKRLRSFLVVLAASLVMTGCDLDVYEMRWLGDRCLTFAHLTARGSRSGIELDSPRIYLTTMRDGLIIRQESFVDEGAALAAAQVSP